MYGEFGTTHFVTLFFYFGSWQKSNNIFGSYQMREQNDLMLLAWMSMEDEKFCRAQGCFLDIFEAWE